MECTKPKKRFLKRCGGEYNFFMHISAGAIVYRINQEKKEVVLLYRKKTDTYHLPKGTQETGEEILDTVLREVREEAGVVVVVKNFLGQLDSQFERDGKIIQKQTHYFLAELVSQNLDQHDQEHDSVLWVDVSTAKKLLQEKGGVRLGMENEMEVLEWFEAC